GSELRLLRVARVDLYVEMPEEAVEPFVELRRVERFATVPSAVRMGVEPDNARGCAQNSGEGRTSEEAPPGFVARIHDLLLSW
ncbi:MAG: hypothetical protein OEW21_17010, partial [Betaproteobacteria bacterium]|nr:hypothetical protein [Betaproteobacteria bacterium]